MFSVILESRIASARIYTVNMKKIINFVIYYAVGIAVLLWISPFVIQKSSFPNYCIGCEFLPKSELVKWNINYFFTLPGALKVILWPLYTIALILMIITS